MTFTDLRTEINNCDRLGFVAATKKIHNIIFDLDKDNLIHLITQIGTIPEDIGHDSKQEKLYTKTSDIILAKALTELNMEAKILTQRADCADIIAQSHYHRYSLVGDAKAFRLSRTAKNAKDYKVRSMVNWKGDNNYSVLVCPYFQYPKTNSQIYKEALDGNVSLFSWEYLYILLKQDIRESETVNLSQLWNQSAIIANTTTIANSKANFLDIQNINIAKLIDLSMQMLHCYFSQIKNILVDRGYSEIQYYEYEIERIKKLNRDDAIKELLKNMKLDSKIATINGFINQLSTNEVEKDGEILQ